MRSIARDALAHDRGRASGAAASARRCRARGAGTRSTTRSRRASAGSRPSSRPVRSASATTRSPSVLSRVSSWPLGEQLPVVDVAPRLEHREHAVELAGQALGLRPTIRRSSRATSRAMRSACHAPRSATSVPGAPCSGCARTAASSVLDARVGVVGGRCRRGRAGAGAARPRPRLERAGSGARTAAGSSIVASRRSGPGKSSGVEAHQRALLGEREHPVAGPAPLLLQHDGPAAAPGRHHDVAGPQRVEPARPGRRARRAGPSSRSASSARYSSMSPAGCGRGRAPRRAARGVRSRCRVERDDVAVGVVLREREVEEVAGLLARVALHEVGGHVVGRAERRRERVRAPRREPGDLVERHERVPQHDHVADVVDAAPARRGPRAACTRPA